MTRLRLLTVLVAVAAALPPAATAAGTHPPRFAVSITASVQSRWTLTNDTVGAACGVENGSGTESSTYSTPTPFVLGPLELTRRVPAPAETMQGVTTRTGSAAYAFPGCIGGCEPANSPVGGFPFPPPEVDCAQTAEAEASGCGTHGYTMAGNGAQFFLGLLNGNELDLEVHLNTEPYEIACPGPQPWPLGLSVEAPVTLARLAARPLTVLRGASSGPWEDQPRLGLHVDRTVAWTIRLRRLPSAP